MEQARVADVMAQDQIYSPVIGSGTTVGICSAWPCAGQEKDRVCLAESPE